MNSQLCLPFHLRFRSRKIERVDPRAKWSKVKSKAFGLLAAWFNLPEKLVNLLRSNNHHRHHHHHHHHHHLRLKRERLKSPSQRARCVVTRGQILLLPGATKIRRGGWVVKAHIRKSPGQEEEEIDRPLPFFSRGRRKKGGRARFPSISRSVTRDE